MQLELATTPRVRCADGSRVPLAPRDAALLAWLALEGPTPRVRLAQVLWPESDGEAARNALRQRLFQLRRQFGDGLLSGSATLLLAPGVSHDLAEADSVLGDVQHDFGPELAAWLTRQRERRQMRMRQSLADLADMAERVHDYADALTHARELLTLEPLSEDAHRRVMRLHYLAGDRAAALLAFDRCEQVLKHEVGAPPARETLALLAHIEASQPEAEGLQPHVLPASLVRPPRQIGRERERDALLAAWAASEPFVLLGVSGIGKSRLLEALAVGWGEAVVVGARPGDDAVPLALLTRVVDQLCARFPALQADDAVLALRPRAGAARPSPRSMVPPLRRLLELAVVEAPRLAVLFDDWQFADDASVDLLHDALGGVGAPAVRWGCASRVLAGARAEARVAALQGRAGLRSVTLEPLPVESVAELVATLALRGADAQRMAPALVRRVGGNPLHVLETLRHMLEERLPLAPDQVGTPLQVKQLVAARLAHVPDSARQLLRVAAVAGDDFCVELAEAVSGRDALALWDDWSVLERMGLFRGQGIAHDLYVEAVHESLPQPIGRVLHGRVAAWMEQRQGEPARLAAHWLEAGDDARAVPHLLAAGRTAWHAARPVEALRFLSKACEIERSAGRLDAAFDHAFECADMVSEIGTPVQMAQCVALAEPLARSDMQQLRVRFLHEVLHFVQGHTELALQAIIGLLSEAIALGDTRVETECRFAIANRAAADGRFDEALHHMAAGERLVRHDGDVRRANSLAGSMAMVMGMRGQGRLAIREHQRMLPLLQAEGDHPTWAVATAAKAVQHAVQAEAAQALADAQSAMDTVARLPIAPPDTMVTLRHTLDALRWCGQWAMGLQAVAVFDRRLSSQGHFPRAGEPVAGLYLQIGRSDLALPLLQVLKAEPPQRRREQLRLALLVLQAGLQQGEAAPALVWPTEALQCEDLILSMEWALWAGLPPELPWPLASFVALAERASRADVGLLERPLRLLVARCLFDAGEATEACRLLPDLSADTLLRDSHGATPWAALYGAQALQRAGQAREALLLARAGMQWLHQRAAELPEPFRDSVLQRHPAHRLLLALAAR